MQAITFDAGLEYAPIRLLMGLAQDDSWHVEVHLTFGVKIEGVVTSETDVLKLAVQPWSYEGGPTTWKAIGPTLLIDYDVIDTVHIP